MGSSPVSATKPIAAPQFSARKTPGTDPNSNASKPVRWALRLPRGYSPGHRRAASSALLGTTPDGSHRPPQQRRIAYEFAALRTLTADKGQAAHPSLPGHLCKLRLVQAHAV